MPLSTIRFVRDALRERRARHRLRNFVILSLRMAAIALLALAIARPLTSVQPLVSPDAPGAAARVVILDVSQSMAALSHGVQQIERARPAAETFLGDSPTLHAGLILAGAAPRPSFDRLSTNMAALRDDLGRAQVRPERLNAQSAINRGAELLAAAKVEPGARRELVVVSDFQRTNWSNVDLSVLPADTAVQFESIAPADELANLAVLRVGIPGRVEQGRDVRLEIEVGNYSKAARQVQIEVTVGASAARVAGLCPPRARTTLSVEAPPHAIGWQSGAARIVDAQDALPADDSRSFVLQVRPPPVFALITRQRANDIPSSSYYLERALAPRIGERGVRVTRIDPEQLDDGVLAAADMIVIDHPGRLTSELARRLALLVKRGRGLLYAAAEPQDAANLSLFAEAAGSDLHLPVEFIPPPPSQRRRDLFWAKVRRDLPPLAAFGEASVWSDELRFAGGLSTRNRDDGLADDRLAEFNDRSSGLVLTACGEGAVAILNADLGASNLPASPAFVPLIGELTDKLLGQRRSGDAVVCGAPAAVYLPAAAGPAPGLKLHGPGDPGQIRDESGGVLWSHGGFGVPGIYHATRNGERVFAFAAGLAAEESDLRPIESTVLAERLGGGWPVSFHSVSGADEERDTAWSSLAFACVVCLLAELLALKLVGT